MRRKIEKGGRQVVLRKARTDGRREQKSARMRALIFALAFLLIVSMFLFAWPVFAQVGGYTGLPPNPDQIGPNQDTNPGFEGSPCTLTGYTGVNANVTATNAQAHTGSCSAKLAALGSGTQTAFDWTMTLHNHEAILFRWWMLGDASVPAGVSMKIAIFDNTHGDGAALWTTGRTCQNTIVASQGWTQACVEFYPNIVAHGGDTQIQARFQITGLTAGNVYLDDLEVEEEWFPVRTVMLAPNYRGYLWSDLVPPVRFTEIQPVTAGSPFWNMQGTPSTPVAGEVMGVTTIDPPAADTLSQLTMYVTMATNPACTTGVLAQETFNSPQSVQPWQITPSQYGSLTIGEKFYICTALYLTSPLTFIDEDVPYAGYYENAAFRSSLTNWYDPNNIWYHNGNQEFGLGTYDRISSLRITGTPTSYSGWFTGGAGLSEFTAPQSTASPSPQDGNLWSDYCAQGFSQIMGSFSTFSGINPTNGSLPGWLQGMSGCGINGNAHWQILNNIMRYLVGGTGTSSNPTFSPTVTTGTGSISANYLFLEAVEFGAPYSQGNSPTKVQSLSPTCTQNCWVTLPSSPVTVNLSTATCVGTNCDATFTMPSCDQYGYGWALYAATGSTSTPPANSSFAWQTPSGIAGMLAEQDIIPCGASVTLSNVGVGPSPPTTDTTVNTSSGFVAGAPSWTTTGMSNQTIWNDYFTTTNSSSYPAGVGGMYMADEPSFYSMNYVFNMESQLYANNLNLPVSCVLIQPTATILWRTRCDLIGEDPYGYNANPSPDEYATGESATQNCSMYQQPNLSPSIEPHCFSSRVDVYVDDATRQTFGARPSWNVIEQFGNSSSYAGYTYWSMYNQLWKAIIDCEVYGSNGCGLLTWGWVDSSGLEQTTMVVYIPAAWTDSKRATNTVRGLFPILESPVEDSPILGVGTVTSGVAYTVSAATACNIQSGQTSMYTNSTLWPDAPDNFVTQTDPASGDQYFLTNNLCGNSKEFQVTYGIANLPAGATSVQVLNQGRSITIQTSGCPNSWTACFTDNRLGTGSWTANTVVALGTDIIDTNGNVEQVTTAGTTGATEPSVWPAYCADGPPCKTGQTTSDNTAVWTNEGPRNIINNYVIKVPRGMTIN